MQPEMFGRVVYKERHLLDSSWSANISRRMLFQTVLEAADSYFYVEKKFVYLLRRNYSK